MRAFAIAGVLMMLAAPAAAAPATSTPASSTPATEPAPLMGDQPAPAGAPVTLAPSPTPAPAPQTGSAPIPDRLILPGRAPPKPPPPKGGELAGYWTGTWTKLEDPLPVAVTFEKTPTGYIGRFDSDALQVAGIPFASVTYSEPNVRFTLQGDMTTAMFSGAVSIDTMEGTFTEGSAYGTFKLTRARSPEGRLRVREVTFANGNVTLAGTFILPPSTPQRARAILFLQGSGPEGRWASRYLAQKFAESGIAALIYDKRGVGGSTGDWRSATFIDLADDAVAGIRFLQRQPEVHPGNIGIYGHSQGGTIAPLVAARAGNVEFVIAAAGSGPRPERAELFSVANSIGLYRLPRGERADAEAFVREIVAVAYRGKERSTLDAMIRSYRGRSWFFEPPPPGDHYWTLSRNIASYRPYTQWKKVKSRVLLVWGRYDERVPVDDSLELIREAIELNGTRERVFRYWIIPGADHNFRLVTRNQYGGWPKRVPDYARRLINWVLWDHGNQGAHEY
jgi:pimeloyl-ACP methyl ester carboxylesterase